MRILNLTQHPCSKEQELAGVIEPANKGEVQRLLTFECLPTQAEIEERADSLAAITVDGECDTAMVGGAPFLMAPLSQSLKKAGITPVYAFSRRESVEKILEDGSVQKSAVFRHLGFV